MKANSFVNPIFAAALAGFTPACFTAEEIREQDHLLFLDDIRLPVEVSGAIERDCEELQAFGDDNGEEVDFDFVADYCRNPEHNDYYPSDWF